MADNDNNVPPLSEHIVQFLRTLNPNDPPLPQIGPVQSDAEDDVVDEFDLRRRQRRQALRRQLNDLGLLRTTMNHERILDWAELLLRLEENSVMLGLQHMEPVDVEDDPYDYIDAATYEQLLLQTLVVESDGPRGAPPVSKAVIEALPTVEANGTGNVNGEVEECTVCKEDLFVVGGGDEVVKVVKKLPCGHMYHDVCIVTWLSLRNTCPVCRYEFATDEDDDAVSSSTSDDIDIMNV